jgi:hypothetical protein
MRTRHSLPLLVLLTACVSPEVEGLMEAEPANTMVKMDFLAKPLPEIPLPNDIATRYDATSATGRRVNASLIAPTTLERRVRELIDQLDGWGVNQAITIPFTGPLDIESILKAHRDPHYDLADDVVYLIDVTPGSPEYGQARHLDVGNGNYPAVLEDINGYWPNDPRGWTNNLFFEEADEDLNRNNQLDGGEDLNGNGVLDPDEDVNGNGLLDLPEDTDADGVLDRPNYLPGQSPTRDDLAGRADALMTFYERETDTLIVRPMLPLRERTTYAVVVTRRLLDAEGNPVGSPFPFINHTGQNEALKPLKGLLPAGLGLKDIAFTFTFTTQSLQSHWIAVRDGLYGHGVQGHLGKEFPAEIEAMLPLKDLANPRFAGQTNPYLLTSEEFLPALRVVGQALLGLDGQSEESKKQLDSHRFVDIYAAGYFQSPQLFERTDENGDPLPFNDQSWPPDLDRKPVKARSEKIYFWLTLPRKEVSVRGEGKMPPIAIVGHGYGSSRFEMATFSGHLARFGLATLSIDCTSHGIGANEMERTLARSLFTGFGLTPFVDTVFSDRAGRPQRRRGGGLGGRLLDQLHLPHPRRGAAVCARLHAIAEDFQELRRPDQVEPRRERRRRARDRRRLRRRRGGRRGQGLLHRLHRRLPGGHHGHPHGQPRAPRRHHRARLGRGRAGGHRQPLPPGRRARGRHPAHDGPALPGQPRPRRRARAQHRHPRRQRRRAPPAGPGRGRQAR